MFPKGKPVKVITLKSPYYLITSVNKKTKARYGVGIKEGDIIQFKHVGSDTLINLYVNNEPKCDGYDALYPYEINKIFGTGHINPLFELEELKDDQALHYLNNNT